jgi:hypothetical protein
MTWSPQIFCVRPREKQFHAIPARRRQQLLRSNQSQLRILLRPQIVLPALAPRYRKQRHVRMQTAREIRQHRRRFIIRMRINI